jgi:DNA repair protein RadC
VFAVLFLDSQNRPLAMEELFRGTLTQTSVYPREVVLRTLHHHAAAVVLAHNHPSGEARPSRADEALTQTLKGRAGAGGRARARPLQRHPRRRRFDGRARSGLRGLPPG